MKVFTVREPYASLIKMGLKKYEFRNLKTKYRGPVLIHASANIFKEELESFKDIIKVPLKKTIVASANLVDCLELNDNLINQLSKENKRVYQKTSCRYKYVWVLSDIKPIKSQIPIKGQLGLWNLEELVYNQIKEENHE